MKEYAIPLFQLNYDEHEIQAVTQTIRSGWISMGPKCIELELQFARMMNSDYALSFSSCTAALHIALLSLGIGQGDEVICPSLTFVATANSILYTGATPVFCDIESPDNPVIDPSEIKKKITSRTKAIIVVHYAGFPCKMKEIMEIASQYGVYVIEDASHAPFSEYEGKKLGSIGDIGCFSFFANKNISTAEGGMLVTKHAHVYEKAKLYRSHGMTTTSYDRMQGHASDYDVIQLGFNYRMDDIRASLALVQIKKLNDDIKRRQNLRNEYIKLLSNLDTIIIPFREHHEKSSNYIMPIVLKHYNGNIRQRVRNYLAQAGIQTSIHYPCIHHFEIYRSYSSYLPRTEYYSANEITLPLYSQLTREQISYIVQNLSAALLTVR